MILSLQIRTLAAITLFKLPIKLNTYVNNCYVMIYLSHPEFSPLWILFINFFL